MKNLFESAGKLLKDLVTPEEILLVNNKFDDFASLDNEEREYDSQSVVKKLITGDDPGGANPAIQIINTYKDYVYGNVSQDKMRRLKFFRQMATFPEVADAMDEICDSCINQDETGEVISLVFSDGAGVDSERQDKLHEEFDQFVSLFDLTNSGWEYFKSLIRDGEISWENVIDENKKEQGILKVNRIMPECYEFLVDRTYEIIGLILNAKILLGDIPEGDSQAVKHSNETAMRGNKALWSTLKGNASGVRHKYTPRTQAEIVPLHINQVTLVTSGDYNEDMSVALPILERARRPYRQLQLIEDAIIIYRLVRAPERLVFNVDTGKLNRNKAEALVQQVMRKFQTKKIYDPQRGTVVNDYDPHSMLDCFWFPKPEGSDGTQVETLGGGQNLGELEDLQYFLRKLYVSLKVPNDRFSEPTNAIENGESISAEEHRFSKFVMRIQQRMAKGIFESFIIHLKLKGIWEKFNLNARSFNVKMTPPLTYEAYEQQKFLNIKMENYNSVSDNDDFSKDKAAMDYLGWNEKDIKKNWARIEEERIREAYLERKISNIEDHGTPDELPEDKGDGGGGW